MTVIEAITTLTVVALAAAALLIVPAIMNERREREQD